MKMPPFIELPEDRALEEEVMVDFAAGADIDDSLDDDTLMESLLEAGAISDVVDNEGNRPPRS